MEFVQPIRDAGKIELMKRILLHGANGPRDYLMFVLGINSGLRISDLLELKMKDIADKKGAPVKRISLREQKTGKAKDFPLGKSSVKAIAVYIKSVGAYEPCDYVFFSKKGGRITRQHAWKILNAAARAAGIKDNIGTHTLRKTFGYHAYNQGVDIALLMETLNHSAQSITLRYIGITQDQKDRVYRGLNL